MSTPEVSEPAGSLMSRVRPGAAVVVWVTAGLAAVAGSSELAARIEAGLAEIEAREECAELRRFYDLREYRPAWSSGGRVSRTAAELVPILEGADQHGLDPEDYDLLGLRRALHEAETEAGLARLDLILSRQFLRFAGHLARGRLDPTTIDRRCVFGESELDLAAALEVVIAGRLEETLLGLEPGQRGYRRLRAELVRLRAVADAGGWTRVPGGETLCVDEPADPQRVLQLRYRLAEEGLLPRDPFGRGDTFDPGLAEAVKRFQDSRGLTPDGKVGPKTLEALNLGPDRLARVIELNLERWRWLPRTSAQRFVLVNIAGFRLDVMEGERSVLSMKAIVGRTYRQTPVFGSAIDQVVFSPNWHVPHRLAVLDELPKVKKDAAYFDKKGFTVYETRDGRTTRVDPSTVDWSTVERGSFPYRLVQSPGRYNALGRVKFLFPNPHNVYLHDTPSRRLFERPSRAFSSGCIRLEKPRELAEYLLRDKEEWDSEAIEAAMARGRERRVRLQETVPVYILYLTAWVTPEGELHFAPDLYDRDARVDRALAGG